MSAWRNMDDEFMPGAPPAVRAAFAAQELDRFEAAGVRGSLLQRVADRFRRLTAATFPLPPVNEDDIPF